MDNSRSAIAAASVRLPSRASWIIATVFPSNGQNPKLVPRLDRVGPATLSGPINPRITRAIVPLPLRFGPTSIRIFCCRVSGVKR